ncbi:hypothetical protein WJ542_01820 [Paraburkholderia sp. B3]|uniref:hypothetical protein n=1 Tax=Paraburkholderia sp. B3 TaxID=3134791 RepID=UPI003982879F
MLVTNPNWMDLKPAKRLPSESLQPWRYVLWTDDTPNFCLTLSHGLRKTGDMPDGVLAAGPEALLDAIEEFGYRDITVYVLDYESNQSAVRLCRVTGIWRERDLAGGISGFWYSTDSGELKPCFRPHSVPVTKLERVIELAAGRR